MEKLTNEEYHARPELSSSDLKAIRKSFNKWYHHKHIKKQESTAAMKFGSAYHTYILEPQNFNKEYFVYDEKPLNSKSNVIYNIRSLYQLEIDIDDSQSLSELKDLLRTSKEEFTEKYPDKSFISQKELDKIIAMENNLLCTKAGELLGPLNQGITEGSFFFNCLGIECRVRPDKIYNNYIFDLKTCEDASPEAFAKQIANFDYDLSAALYIHGLEKNDIDVNGFILLAQEKKAPYFTAPYLLSTECIANGFRKIEQALGIYKSNIDKEHTNSYFEELQEIELPVWGLIS